jgi:dolichol-phosphate mannosyltransferase
MELSVVIPARDEAENLPILLGEIRAALDHVIDYEVIVVDDGSTDGTSAVVRAERRAMPQLRLVRHSTGYGQSSAIHSGITAAASPWIATLDGDGQNDPADIPRLWARLQEAGTAGNFMLVGNRVSRKDTPMRRLSSRLANAIRAWLLKDRTPDTGCSLKLFRRDAFLALPFFDHMHRFLPALVLRQGGEVHSMPVNHRPRQRGISKYGIFDRLWVGVWDLLGVMWLQRRMKPRELLRDDI